MLQGRVSISLGTHGGRSDRSSHLLGLSDPSSYKAEKE